MLNNEMRFGHQHQYLLCCNAAGLDEKIKIWKYNIVNEKSNYRLFKLLTCIHTRNILQINELMMKNLLCYKERFNWTIIQKIYKTQNNTKKIEIKIKCNKKIIKVYEKWEYLLSFNWTVAHFFLQDFSISYLYYYLSFSIAEY